jgi:hypothetical protein
VVHEEYLFQITSIDSNQLWSQGGSYSLFDCAYKSHLNLSWIDFTCRPATPEEVERVLLHHAEKQGWKPGVKFEIDGEEFVVEKIELVRKLTSITCNQHMEEKGWHLGLAYNNKNRIVPLEHCTLKKQKYLEPKTDKNRVFDFVECEASDAIMKNKKRKLIAYVEKEVYPFITVDEDGYTDHFAYIRIPYYDGYDKEVWEVAE